MGRKAPPSSTPQSAPRMPGSRKGTTLALEFKRVRWKNLMGKSRVPSMSIRSTPTTPTSGAICQAPSKKSTPSTEQPSRLSLQLATSGTRSDREWWSPSAHAGTSRRMGTLMGSPGTSLLQRTSLQGKTPPTKEGLLCCWRASPNSLRRG